MKQIIMIAAFWFVTHTASAQRLNFEIYNSPSGSDTIFVDTSKLFMTFDTTFSFNYIKSIAS
ncbi:MAG: hypothetical protein PSX81_08875 [bacterium]|nr:hypothetical protein [bacterium]